MGKNANITVAKLLGYKIMFLSYSNTVEMPPTHYYRCHIYKWIREIREMSKSHKV